MIKMPTVDFEAWDTVFRAPSDSDEAANALLIAAKYIRERKPLPHGLDGYIAGAIEYSMRKDKKHRNTAFLRELHLAAENRRPAKGDWHEVGNEVEMMIDDHGYSQNKATKEVAKKHGISASTAKRWYQKNLAAKELVWELNEEENKRPKKES